MEVDHFNPTLVGSARNKYDNLFLGTRHCNGCKSHLWPTAKERKKGIYILNPCKEQDYGSHIFEHPETHRLIGVTTAGDFHITACDLNANHLVIERRERAAIHVLMHSTPIVVKDDNSPLLPEYVKLLNQQLEKMIPMIPYLPKDHPKYTQEIELWNLLASMP
jgi:hypothetical protein